MLVSLNKCAILGCPRDLVSSFISGLRVTYVPYKLLINELAKFLGHLSEALQKCLVLSCLEGALCTNSIMQ